MDVHFPVAELIDKCVKSWGASSPEETFNYEQDIACILRKIRNDFPNNREGFWDIGANGHIFTSRSMPRLNERKFSNVYDYIFKLNDHNVDLNVRTRHDAYFNALIDQLDSDTLWHEITDDKLLDSPTPGCLISRISYMRDRNKLMLEIKDVRDKQQTPLFQSIALDRKIKVDNDRFLGKKKETTIMSVLKFRMREELNPYYGTHPCEILLVNTLVQKAQCATYYNYGLRYLQLVMEKIRSPDYDYYHLPIEFKSDGTFVTIQWHTFIMAQLRYIINLQSLMLHNVLIHQYAQNYTALSDELLLYILSNPYSQGKALKKMFSPINLYYGMDQKMAPNTGNGFIDTLHLHPVYSVDKAKLAEYPTTYVQHGDCERCSTQLDKSVYTQNVRDQIKNSLDSMVAANLPLLVAYIKNNLLPCRPNKFIIYDVVFIRMHTSAGGYAHSHKLRDFIPAIRKAYSENNEYKIDDQCGDRVKSDLVARLKHVGYTQTINLLDNYPDPHQFSSGYARYLTSKSAGLAPIHINMTFLDERNKLVSIRSSTTSKAARAMLTGGEIFDLSKVESKYNKTEAFKATLSESQLKQVDEEGFSDSQLDKIVDTDAVLFYYSSVTEDDQKRILRDGLSETDLGLMGVSRIGSRSTAGFRAIRAIFMMRLEVHILQCAIIQPHIEATSRNYRDNDPPRDMWINDHDYGYSIYTQQQTGSDDVFAPYVMASGSGRFLISCADCTAWDQHVKPPYLHAFYRGVYEAFDGDVRLHDKVYMCKYGKSLNLAECTEEFMKYQLDSSYIAEYGDEAAIVPVNFLTSGRLDTFAFNSIQNSLINEIVQRQLLEHSTAKAKYVRLTVAGDDMASILDMSNVQIRSSAIEEIKNIIVHVYRQAGHDISTEKTTCTNRSMEIAKRYCYYGSSFRDPNIQFFESEKNNKAETIIDSLRGQVQKQYEAMKRSDGSLCQSAFAIRIYFALAYNLKIQEKSLTVRGVNHKYYPPYASIITPTSASGGLGCTFTGITMNEAIFLMKHLRSYIDASLPIVDALKFTSNKDIPSALIRSVIPVEKHSLEPGLNTKLKLIDIKTVSANNADVPMSVGSGLNYKLHHQLPQAMRESSNAINSLENQGIVVPEKLKYSNGPYINFLQFTDTIGKTRSTDKNDVANNLGRFFNIEKRKLREHPTPVTLSKKYEIYKAMACEAIIVPESALEYKTDSIRNVTAPDVAQKLERVFGPRIGKHMNHNFEGLNQEIQRFISKTGLQLTTQQLIDEILRVGINNSHITPSQVLLQLLIAVSGDTFAANEVISNLGENQMSWGDMLVAVTLSGSILENLDLRHETVSKLVVMNMHTNNQLLNLYRYSAYVYMQQYNAYFGRFGSNATSIIVRATEMLPEIENMLANKGVNNSRASVRNFNQNVYDMYTSNKAQFNAAKSLLVDDNHV